MGKDNQLQVVLNFEGYTTVNDISDSNLDYNGIYVAFAGKPDELHETYYCNKVLYIGKADKSTISERMADHKNKDFDEWSKKLEGEEELVFSFAKLENKEPIGDIENALIFKNKPIFNKIGKDKYAGDAIFITSNNQKGNLLKIINITY